MSVQNFSFLARLEVAEKFVEVGWVAQAMWDRLHRLCGGVVVQAKFRVQL